MAADAGGDMVQELLEVLIRGVGWTVLKVVTLGRYRSAGRDALLFEGAIGLVAVGALLWATYAWMG
jgi:hypothetical protein